MHMEFWDWAHHLNLLGDVAQSQLVFVDLTAEMSDVIGWVQCIQILS